MCTNLLEYSITPDGQELLVDHEDPEPQVYPKEQQFPYHITGYHIPKDTWIPLAPVTPNLPLPPLCPYSNT